MDRYPATKLDDQFDACEFRLAGAEEYQQYARFWPATASLPPTHVTLIEHDDRGKGGIFIRFRTVPKSDLRAAEKLAPAAGEEPGPERFYDDLKKLSTPDLQTRAAEIGVSPIPAKRQDLIGAVAAKLAEKK